MLGFRVYDMGNYPHHHVFAPHSKDSVRTIVFWSLHRGGPVLWNYQMAMIDLQVQGMCFKCLQHPNMCRLGFKAYGLGFRVRGLVISTTHGDCMVRNDTGNLAHTSSLRPHCRRKKN